MKSLIFVVDAEPEVCELARNSLEAAGYSVEIPSSILARFDVEAESPSLIVVGMSLLKEHSFVIPYQNSQTSGDRTPWLVMLDGSSAGDRAIALDYGADDCIVKPFSPRELLARVEGVLRRSSQSRSAWSAGTADIVIDSWAMKLMVRGIEIPATTLEFRLLEYLARHAGQVFTRDFLLDAVWGDMRFINPRSVDACIRRIREKIEPDSAKPILLKTVRGVGYRMDATAIWQSAPTEICDCHACRTRISALRFHEAGLKRRRESAEG
ncbi:MAG TPA: response regulator transcription factor [Verrucomicrobiae bacterium]|nr:response regulator transcription factor [Verrucomicrobiae bacterium]